MYTRAIGDINLFLHSIKQFVFYHHGNQSDKHSLKLYTHYDLNKVLDTSRNLRTI